MMSPKKCTATEFALRCLLLLALWTTGSLALAAPVVGMIVQLSGPLVAKKPGGTLKVLSMKSEVENGDTLVTEKNTYAMIKFIDNSEITLRPGTTMTIENFSFASDNKDGDHANFNLVKGGLRSVTGLLGKRSKEKFELKTPAATIGIRGTTFIAEIVPVDEQRALASAISFLHASTASLPVASDAGPIAPVMLAQAMPPPGPVGGLTPGLYVQVLDGMIHVSNSGGTLNFAAGQFGFTPSLTVPPIILPANPGLKFSPPPIFNSSSAPSAGSSPPKPNEVDCIVR